MWSSHRWPGVASSMRITELPATGTVLKTGSGATREGPQPGAIWGVRGRGGTKRSWFYDPDLVPGHPSSYLGWPTPTPPNSRDCEPRLPASRPEALTSCIRPHHSELLMCSDSSSAWDSQGRCATSLSCFERGQSRARLCSPLSLFL